MPHVRHSRLFETPPEHVFVFSRHEARFLALAFEAAYPTVRRRIESATDVPPPARKGPRAVCRRSHAQGA
jgi:hypothetical protein